MAELRGDRGDDNGDNGGNGGGGECINNRIVPSNGSQMKLKAMPTKSALPLWIFGSLDPTNSFVDMFRYYYLAHMCQCRCVYLLFYVKNHHVNLKVHTVLIPRCSFQKISERLINNVMYQEVKHFIFHFFTFLWRAPHHRGGGGPHLSQALKQ